MLHGFFVHRLCHTKAHSREVQQDVEANCGLCLNTLFPRGLHLHFSRSYISVKTNAWKCMSAQFRRTFMTCFKCSNELAGPANIVNKTIYEFRHIFGRKKTKFGLFILWVSRHFDNIQIFSVNRNINLYRIY